MPPPVSKWGKWGNLISGISMAAGLCFHFFGNELARAASVSLISASETGLDSSALTYTVAFGAPASAITLYVYTTSIRKYGINATFRLSCMTCLVVFILMTYASLAGFLQYCGIKAQLIVIAFYSFREIYATLISTQQWAFIISTLDTSSSSYIVTFSGAISIASTIGGLCVEHIVHSFGVLGLLFASSLACIATVICSELAFLLHKQHIHRQHSLHHTHHSSQSNPTANTNDSSNTTHHHQRSSDHHRSKSIHKVSSTDKITSSSSSSSHNNSRGNGLIHKVSSKDAITNTADNNNNNYNNHRLPKVVSKENIRTSADSTSTTCGCSNGDIMSCSSATDDVTITALNPADTASECTALTPASTSSGVRRKSSIAVRGHDSNDSSNSSSSNNISSSSSSSSSNISSNGSNSSSSSSSSNGSNRSSSSSSITHHQHRKRDSISTASNDNSNSGSSSNDNTSSNASIAYSNQHQTPSQKDASIKSNNTHSHTHSKDIEKYADSHHNRHSISGSSGTSSSATAASSSSSILKKPSSSSSSSSMFGDSIRLLSNITLQLLVGEAVAHQCCANIQHIIFYDGIRKNIINDDERAVTVGRFYATVNLTACFLQFFIVPRLLTQSSLPIIMLSIPIVVSVIGGICTIWPSLIAVMVGFGALKVLEYAVLAGAMEMIYMPLDSETRYLGKEYVRFFGTKLGKTGASLLFSFMTSQLQPSLSTQCLWGWIFAIAWSCVMGLLSIHLKEKVDQISTISSPHLYSTHPAHINTTVTPTSTSVASAGVSSSSSTDDIDDHRLVEAVVSEGEKDTSIPKMNDTTGITMSDSDSMSTSVSIPVRLADETEKDVSVPISVESSSSSSGIPVHFIAATAEDTRAADTTTKVNEFPSINAVTPSDFTSTAATSSTTAATTATSSTTLTAVSASTRITHLELHTELDSILAVNSTTTTTTTTTTITTLPMTTITTSNQMESVTNIIINKDEEYVNRHSETVIIDNAGGPIQYMVILEDSSKSIQSHDDNDDDDDDDDESPVSTSAKYSDENHDEDGNEEEDEDYKYSLHRLITRRRARSMSMGDASDSYFMSAADIMRHNHNDRSFNNHTNSMQWYFNKLGIQEEYVNDNEYDDRDGHYSRSPLHSSRSDASTGSGSSGGREDEVYTTGDESDTCSHTHSYTRRSDESLNQLHDDSEESSLPRENSRKNNLLKDSFTSGGSDKEMSVLNKLNHHHSCNNISNIISNDIINLPNHNHSSSSSSSGSSSNSSSSSNGSSSSSSSNNLHLMTGSSSSSSSSTTAATTRTAGAEGGRGRGGAGGGVLVPLNFDDYQSMVLRPSQPSSSSLQFSSSSSSSSSSPLDSRAHNTAISQSAHHSSSSSSSNGNGNSSNSSNGNSSKSNSNSATRVRRARPSSDRLSRLTANTSNNALNNCTSGNSSSGYNYTGSSKHDSSNFGHHHHNSTNHLYYHSTSQVDMNKLLYDPSNSSTMFSTTTASTSSLAHTSLSLSPPSRSLSAPLTLPKSPSRSLLPHTLSRSQSHSMPLPLAIPLLNMHDTNDAASNISQSSKDIRHIASMVIESARSPCNKYNPINNRVVWNKSRFPVGDVNTSSINIRGSKCRGRKRSNSI